MVWTFGRGQLQNHEIGYGTVLHLICLFLFSTHYPPPSIREQKGTAVYGATQFADLSPAEFEAMFLNQVRHYWTVKFTKNCQNSYLMIMDFLTHGTLMHVLYYTYIISIQHRITKIGITYKLSPSGHSHAKCQQLLFIAIYCYQLLFTAIYCFLLLPTATNCSCNMWPSGYEKRHSKRAVFEEPR